MLLKKKALLNHLKLCQEQPKEQLELVLEAKQHFAQARVYDSMVC